MNPLRIRGTTGGSPEGARASRSHTRSRAGSLFLTFALSHLLTGCAATTDSHQLWKQPIAFSGRNTDPQVVVYGPLIHLLPHFDATPTLDLILYGPNDYGKTMLRNPQGMGQLGNHLIVCDQGRPDLISIDLTNGQSNGWTDRHHTPRCPVDVCMDGGRVFVADTTNRSVLVYTSAGKFITELTPPEANGPSTRQAQDAKISPAATPTLPVRTFRPTAVRAHDGVLYVADIGYRRLERYDLQQQRWLGPFQATAGFPRIAALTGMDISSNGTLHIVDSLQQCVLRVRRDGSWLPPIGRPGRGLGEFVRPKAICCSASGLLLITDAARQSILVFRSDGSFLTEICETAGWKGFTLPAGIARLSSAPALFESIAKRGWKVPDELIVASDAMGGLPLIVLGIVKDNREVRPGAH